ASGILHRVYTSDQPAAALRIPLHELHAKLFFEFPHTNTLPLRFLTAKWTRVHIHRADTLNQTERKARQQLGLTVTDPILVLRLVGQA
ncbi:unnamed protein product, partial [Amoebophrya sp. A120]